MSAKGDPLLHDHLVSRFNDPDYRFAPREQALYFKSLFNVNGFKQIKGAEIGVFYGLNLRTMAEIIPNSFFYGIDPFEVYFNWNIRGRATGRVFQIKWDQSDWEQAYKRTKEYFDAVPNVELLRLKSDEAVWHVPDDFNFVYIDGAHDYYSTIEDITLWEEKCVCGAIIAGHDYKHKVKYKTVTLAVNHYAKMYGRKIHNPAYPIWWWYKE